MIYYADGGGWNGYRSRLCVCDEANHILIQSFPDPFTNNIMEYKALLVALELCERHDDLPIEIRTDSELVCAQIKMEMPANVSTIQQPYRCINDSLKPLLDQCLNLIYRKSVHIRQVPRKDNLAGLLLEAKRGDRSWDVAPVSLTNHQRGRIAFKRCAYNNKEHPKNPKEERT